MRWTWFRHTRGLPRHALLPGWPRRLKGSFRLEPLLPCSGGLHPSPDWHGLGATFGRQGGRLCVRSVAPQRPPAKAELAGLLRWPQLRHVRRRVDAGKFVPDNFGGHSPTTSSIERSHPTSDKSTDEASNVFCPAAKGGAWTGADAHSGSRRSWRLRQCVIRQDDWAPAQTGQTGETGATAAVSLALERLNHGLSKERVGVDVT